MADSTKRLTVAEASSELGISKEAVRKRIDRGTLNAEKGEDGTWTVLLEATTSTQDNVEDNGRVLVLQAKLDALERAYEAQKSEIEYLRDENKRKDSIIMNLSNKIPQLPEKASESRSWWRFWK